ncbi:hypothetical protein PM082_005596 [Marasmius tenuissimus]|nr:hypothetical protein PM082_005596 [Marasmius tenuissimus]
MLHHPTPAIQVYLSLQFSSIHIISRPTNPQQAPRGEANQLWKGDRTENVNPENSEPQKKTAVADVRVKRPVASYPLGVRWLRTKMAQLAWDAGHLGFVEARDQTR